MSRSRIVSRDLRQLSDWVTLAVKTIVSPTNPTAREFHSLVVNDYVTVLAVTLDGTIPLVRQYRPALETVTLELPGGLREKNEDPSECARRELKEETGFRAEKSIKLLGTLYPDSGRLENRLWCYYANPVHSIKGWEEETDVERVFMTKEVFVDAIRNGEFTMALHIAVTALAILTEEF